MYNHAISWETTYLLGWHSISGKLNLTSWQGEMPWIDVVVVGANDTDMSHIMWDNAMHKSFELLLISPDVNPKKYARDRNGIWAFGWFMKSGFKRPPMRPLIDRWEWLNKMRGTT